MFQPLILFLSDGAADCLVVVIKFCHISGHRAARPGVTLIAHTGRVLNLSSISLFLDNMCKPYLKYLQTCCEVLSDRCSPCESWFREAIIAITENVNILSRYYSDYALTKHRLSAKLIDCCA